jgi:hypothetical protein
MTSPSQARNSIKKCLKTILDPKPTATEINQLWDYFDSSCAYCGIHIDRVSRTGHKDHLVAQSEGGLNGLSNLILSCSICNGDEKLESDWQQFLKMKCTDNSELFDQRRKKILGWIETNGGRERISEQEQTLVDVAFNQINAVFSEQVEDLRRHRDA